MNNTPYFSYNLPQPNDVADVSKINANFTNLDAYLHRAIGEGYADTDTLDSRVEALEDSATLSKIATNHFTDGIDSYVKSLKVSIVPSQSGSGTPSPSNVRTISGFTECTVTDNGKNLLNNTATSQTISGVTFTVNSDGTITANGTATASILLIINSELTLPNGEYILSGCPTGGTYNTYGLQSTEPYVIDYGSGVALTSNGETTTIRIRIGNGTVCNNIVFRPMIRLANDTDNTYVPYVEPTTATIQLGSAGTVYGGTVDLISGKLVVDKKIVTLDENTTWTEYTTGKFFANDVTSGAITVDVDTKYISNLYQFKGTGASTSASITTDKSFYGQNAYNRIWIYDSQYDTVSDLTQALSTTPMQVVYPFTPSQTYQLTPAQLRSLVGTNNLTSSTGEVTEVEYITNTTIAWILDLILGGN